MGIISLRSPLMFWLTSLSILSCVTVLFPIHDINAETNSSDFTKQSSKKYNAQQLYDRAIKKFNGEDYEGAIADITRVIEQNPNFAPAYNNRGAAKYRLKRYRGAIADFNEAIRIDPSNVQYQKNQRSAQNDLDTALAEANNTQQSSQNTVLPQKQASQDCIDLTIMTKLAEIGEGDAESIKIIKQLKFNACDLGLDLGSSFNYANGQTAKWSGSWNYPNGQTAKWSGSWNYPNGQTAKWSGSWNYPNGQTAKWSGSWNYPNGQTAGAIGVLLTYSCSNLGEQACSNRLSDFKSMDTFFQDLTAIELAWLAYKSEQNQQKRN